MHSIPEPEAAVSLMQVGAVDQANLSSSRRRQPSVGLSSPSREFDFLAAASKWRPETTLAAVIRQWFALAQQWQIVFDHEEHNLDFLRPQSVPLAWQFTGRSDKLPYDVGGDRDLPDFVVVLPPSGLGSRQSGGICNFTSAADRAPLRAAMIRTHR